MLQFSALSRDGGVYHTYCLNYMAALNYLEQLRKSDEFAEFEKVKIVLASVCDDKYEITDKSSVILIKIWSVIVEFNFGSFDIAL